MATYTDRNTFLAAVYSSTGTSRKNFNGAVLKNLPLNGVCLRHCDFTSAAFDGSDLRGVDFSDSILTSATFVGCLTDNILMLGVVGASAATLGLASRYTTNPPDNYDSFTS